MREVIERSIKLADRTLVFSMWCEAKELADMLGFMCAHANKIQARDAAEKWIADNLIPATSKDRLHVKALKHVAEQKNNVGHLRHPDFRQLLIDAGFKVTKNNVYAKFKRVP